MASDAIMAIKKLQAKRYFINFFWTNKAISKKVNVTEKTVGKWIKEGNWKEQQEANVTKKENATITKTRLVNAEFMDWVGTQSPATADLISELVIKFIMSKPEQKKN